MSENIPWEFRRAETKDLALLVELRLTMRRERETVALQMPETEFRRLNEEYFRKGLLDPETVFLLAYEGEEVAGCAAMTVHVHAPSYGNPGGRTGYIFNVYTVPKFRKRGLAAQFLAQLTVIARELGCGKMGLNSSPAGKNVYLRFGFREIAGEMELDLQN